MELCVGCPVRESQVLQEEAWLEKRILEDLVRESETESEADSPYFFILVPFLHTTSHLLLSCPPRRVLDLRTFPLAWCKTVHPGDNGGIYQILLRLVSRIRKELDERQDSVDAL